MEEPYFSGIFHQSSKNHAKGHPPVPKHYEDWPDEWKTTYYKAYPRLPKIKLEDGPPRADFFDLIKARQSRRDFSGEPLAKRDLSLLLKYSCGNVAPMEDGRHRRAQPSGGARFPIEVYPILFRGSGDCKAGLYHYNVQEHALDVLFEREFADGDVGELFTYPWVRNAAGAFVMTAVFGRNQGKYGERGYRQILQEAGHIAQNAYLVSEALGLKCCALSGTRDENLEKFIDIDGVTESVVYALALGK